MNNQHAIKEKLQQEKKYMFGKCWDRIQAQGRFVICEYSWLEQDRNGQFAHIMNEMYISVQSRFDNYLVQQEIKDIEKYQNDLNKNINKKKKKKGKKKGTQSKDEKAEQSEHQEINFNDKKSQRNPSEEKADVSNLVAKKVEQKRQDLEVKKQQQKLEKQNSEETEINDKNASNKQSTIISAQQIEKPEQTKDANKKEQQKPASQISSFKQKSDSYTDSTCKIESSSQKIAQQSDGKDTQKDEQRHTTKTKQYEQQYATDKNSEISQQSQLSTNCLKPKPKSKSLSKTSITGVSMKKLETNLQESSKKQKQEKQLQIIMGNAMQCHAKFLTEESEKFQHTRKAAIDLLRQFLSTQEIKCKWQLVMFGSCEVGYALKQSDIDLVLRIEDSKSYSLKTMQQVLKFYPWILECQYISTANVPIITLKVNLYQAKKLSNRLLKKLDKCQTQGENILQFAQDFIVTVDISICGLKQQYGGVVSSNNLRFLFYQNQPLKKMVFILKDVLRRKQLNKTYRGGVNSYVLTMLIYGIIKKKQLQLTKSKSDNQNNMKSNKDYLQGLKTNLYAVFCQISNYLKDFVPFETLINPLDENIQSQKDIHLNIVDPFSKKLVKTSAFRIDDIIEELQALRIFLDAIKDEIKFQDLENKKIKFEIFEKISQYMSELEPSVISI